MPVIELSLDSSGAITGLKKYSDEVTRTERKTSSSFDKMRDKVNSYSGVVTAAMTVGIAALAAFSKATLGMASSLNESTGVYNQAFEGMTETSNQWLADLRQNYSLSEVVAKQTISTLKLVFNGMDVIDKKGGEMSHKLVQRAADLAAAFDRSTVDVVNDIRSALSGSMETLDKYGVVIRQSTVNQKALEMGLAETTKEITQADRAQATYNLILEKSSTLAGTSAREQKGYAGQLKESTKNITDLATAIGQQLIPMATTALTKFNEWISAAGRTQQILNVVVETIRALGNGFFGLELVLKGSIVVIAKLAESFIKLAYPLKVILDGLEAVGAIDSNPIQELMDVANDFTKSAVEGFGNTVEKIDAFNNAIDESKTKINKTADSFGTLKTKTDESTKALESNADILGIVGDKAKRLNEKAKENAAAWRDSLNPAIDEGNKNMKNASSSADKLSSSLSKVTSKAKSAAAAVKQVGHTKEGTYKASKAWSGGSYSFSSGGLSSEEQALYKQLTPAGRGNDFYKRYGHRSGVGSAHEYLDIIQTQQKAAMAQIMQKRKMRASGEVSPANGITQIFNFNQQVSRSDISNISRGMILNSART